MTGADTHLAGLFAEFARTSATRAPLYSAIAALCVDAPWCHELMGHAEPAQRRPVLWFAALHRICRTHRDEPLAEFMATLTEHRREPTELSAGDLADFAQRHRAALIDLISTRRTQTNEVGRCALFLPPLARVHAETGEPIALLDVGASAGLNLLFDRYGYVYEPGPSIQGDPEAPVLHCGVRGTIPLPAAIPPVAARRGLDIAPIDPTDPQEADWLRACVWADQTDRARLLDTALALAHRHRPEVHRGDAAVDLAAHLEALAPHGHLVVLTSWVVSYLSPTATAAFLATCEAWGAQRDLTWVALEVPADLAPLTVDVVDRRAALTHVITRTWRAGVARQHTWASAHPHGYWMHAVPGRD